MSVEFKEINAVYGIGDESDRACVISSEVNFTYQDQLRERLPCLNHRRLP